MSAQVELPLRYPGMQDPATTALLALIEGDPLHEEDRARIVEAIVADARKHDGHVDPNRVRTALTNEHGLTVYPRVIGAVYSALVTAHRLEFTGWVTSTDKAGGNRGKPARAYRLTNGGAA